MYRDDEAADAMYDELQAEELARQRTEWVIDGGDLADFAPHDVHAKVQRRMDQMARNRREQVAEYQYEMRGLYALN